MNLLIDFIDETEEVKEEYMSLIREVLEKAAQMENIEDGAEVSVTFVDNERIREINRDYRDKDQPTDVISFAMEEMGEGEMEIVGAEMPRMLGILLSLFQGRKSKLKSTDILSIVNLDFGVTWLLHLLGYDHMTEEDEKKCSEDKKKF